MTTRAAKGSVLVADFYSLSFVRGEYLPGTKAATNVLKLTDEEFGFGLDFSSNFEAAFGQFAHDHNLGVGATFFLGATSKKGPYMVVAELTV